MSFCSILFRTVLSHFPATKWNRMRWNKTQKTNQKNTFQTQSDFIETMFPFGNPAATLTLQIFMLFNLFLSELYCFILPCARAILQNKPSALTGFFLNSIINSVAPRGFKGRQSMSQAPNSKASLQSLFLSGGKPNGWNEPAAIQVNNQDLISLKISYRFWQHHSLSNFWLILSIEGSELSSAE